MSNHFLRAKFLRLPMGILALMVTSFALASPVIPVQPVKPNANNNTTNNTTNQVLAIPTKPQTVIVPGTPDLNAKAFVLMDANSGKIIAEKNADMRLAPASLTKLMTMYVISDAVRNGNVKLDDKVRISTKAWQTGGSRMFVKVNDEVPVRDLLQGIVVASGNDAAVAMAEYLAGTEDAFAGLMNNEAKVIGMSNSHFIDSNGLPNPNHYSTAKDLALLAQAIIKNFPEDYKLYSEKYFTFNNIKQPNRNRLLWRFPYADGLKTGHTDEAGYCLVGSAVKGETRFISVIMGAPNDNVRTEDSIRLLTYGFRFYETHKFYNGNKPLVTVRVFKGKIKEIPMGLANDFVVTIPAGQLKNIKAEMQLDDPVRAPIVKGQSYGKINLVLNNNVIASTPLIAMADDPKGGIFRSIADSVTFSFHKLFSKSDAKLNNG